MIPAAVRRSREPLGPVEAQLQGLFHQNMLAGGKASLRHLEVAARRREDQHGVDGRVPDGGIEIGGRAKGKLRAIGLGALG